MKQITKDLLESAKRTKFWPKESRIKNAQTYKYMRYTGMRKPLLDMFLNRVPPNERD
jgi:hypothetical protein